MNELVTCRNLTKRYGSKFALNNVSLSIESGKIVGLLGPNGSGKTTLIKILNQLITPTSGEVLIGGSPLTVETKAKISYLPDRMCLGNWMHVADAIVSSLIFTQTLTAAARRICSTSCISVPPTPSVPCPRARRKSCS